MKRILFICATILLLAGCGKTDSYKVSGNVAGLEGTVYMLDEYGEEISSAEVKNGRFTLTGEAAEIAPVLLRDESEIFAVFFLENGNIKITGDIAEGSIEATGTIANDRSTDFDRNYYKFVEDFLARNENPDINVFMEETMAISEKAIDDNKDNFFGIYKLSEMEREWSGEMILEKLSQFPSELRNTPYALKLAENATLKKRTDIGQPYTDITLADPNGKETRMSDYTGEGKYVLIDFWASWCGPCMEEIPYLKEVYNKYHRKGFEIFGVSMDRDKQAWTEAVNEHAMNWVHVYHEQESEIAGIYSIVSIPANFLVGPDGTIIAKNLRGEQLEQTLSALIK